MSVVVTIDDLPSTLGDYPWGYLVTVSDDLRAHTLAVPTDWREDALHANAGRSSRANITVRPNVTMVFPHPQPGGYSLIVDGDAKAYDDHVEITPTWAVMHRPALPTG
ncbi:MAG: pyridoxamine 5'-phosphate oxidase family protein [Actinomycetota bacterium]|nr:pyridoxamine 5'-phosphate oxidase family protein [Actinomycetota bacterium]